MPLFSTLYRKAKGFLSSPRKVRTLAARFLWVSGFGRFMIIRHSRFVMRFHRSAMSAAYWLDLSSRRDDELILEVFLSEGDHFVDVGANIGTLTLLGSRLVGDTGRVVAIEAHPRTAKYLRANIRLNGFTNIHVVQSAAGEMPSSAAMSDSFLDDQNTLSTDGNIQVQVLPLDDLVPADIRPRLLKLDTEGHELAVLRGGRRVLELSEVVYCEAFERALRDHGATMREVLMVLANAGFTLYRFSSEQGTWIDIEAGWKPEAVTNIVGLRVGRDDLLAALRRYRTKCD